MVEVLTAAQMRSIEQEAISSGEVTGLALMERAGRGVVDAVFEQWPELAKTSHRAVVLCGPGNNGGDGFVVARLLKEWGWDVEAFLYGDPERLPPDARLNYDRWCALGAVQSFDDVEDSWARLALRANLMIDALFGTGLTRPLPEQLCDMAGTLRLYRPSVGGAITVSVDIASGLCSCSGAVLGDVFPSDLTVTFHSQKLGHYLGGQFTGALRVADLGLPKSVEAQTSLTQKRDGQIDRVSAKPTGEGETNPTDFPVRLIDGLGDLHKCAGHKFDHGHALVLSGPCNRTGAARLAARGALRIGAGLVTVGAPPDAMPECAAQLTAIMLQEVVDHAGLVDMLKDDRINALCLGPGLGHGPRARSLIAVALDAKRPTVLDADALSVLFFDEADALFGKLHERCVLTPHAGEFKRMFPEFAGKLNETPVAGPAYSKVDAVRDAAKRAGCVVLFKGVDTVIADPSGRASINSAQYERNTPWLATAGSGDVLAGFITGLLARGYPIMQAAEAAAFLHVECALKYGPGLIAEDLPEIVPRVLSD